MVNLGPRDERYAQLPPRTESDDFSPERVLFYFDPEQMKQLSLYGKIAFFSFMGGAVILSGAYDCQPNDSNPEKCIHFVNRIRTSSTALFALSTLCCGIIAKTFVQSWIPARN